MAYATELQSAMRAVTAACKVCRTVQKRLAGSPPGEGDYAADKQDRSPVTVADFAAQAAIIAALRDALPEDPVVGEEDADILRDPRNRELAGRVTDAVRTVIPGVETGEICDLIDAGRHAGGPEGRFWTLDPIDGTKGFLRGEQYAVALGLIEDGEVVLGVLGCPNLPFPDMQGRDSGSLLLAVKGEGAFQQALDGGGAESIAVDPGGELETIRLAESVEAGHSSHAHSARIAEALGIAAEPLRIDSQCKYAVCARGEAGIYLRLPTRKDYEEKIWDHAAGCIIATEAGAVVTDIHGKGLDFSHGRTLKSNQGVVLAHAAVHGRLLRAVTDVLEA